MLTTLRQLWRPTPPPRFLFIEINQSCNLRCAHCVYWTHDDSDKANYLSWPRRREVLEEFAEMCPGGAVVICGGEPMLDLDTYFAIAATCTELGLRSISVVNGTRIRGPEMAERMVRFGPDEISISLNSPSPDLHDETRGVKGAFDKAVTALRLLLAARARFPERGTRIYVMGLMFDASYRDLDAFYDLVLNDIGADKLKLNFLQPSFGDGSGEDRFFAEHARMDPDELADLLRRCEAKYGLGFNPAWMDNVLMYVRSVNAGTDNAQGWSASTRTSAHICNTYERNIMVNPYGLARLCFSSAFRGMPLRARGDLRRFWIGAEDIREKMRSCNALCGISHSVRRESSTLASARSRTHPAPA